MISRFAELFLFGVAPLLIGLVAMPAGSAAAGKTIEGEVLYRERIALPPDAEILVQLADVSLADASARIIAEQTIRPAGQVPVPFSLSFDPAELKSGRSYALQARITVGERLWFITDTRNTVDPVAPDGPHTLLLKMVRQSDTSQDPSDASIFDRTWLAEDIEESGVIDNAQSTFQIGRDGKISGRGACNSYFSTAAVDGTGIRVGEIGSTFMACPEAVMEQEKKFFAALRKSVGFRLDEAGKLLLLDPEGRTVLRFAPAG